MATKKLKPMMAWAGVVDDKIQAWRHMVQPYAEVYLTRKAARKNYEVVVRVKITPINGTRSR